MLMGYIQCRTPMDEDDDGLPVPAGPWENLTDELVSVETWQFLLSEAGGNMRVQGSTGIYTDPAGMEYRFSQVN